MNFGVWLSSYFSQIQFTLWTYTSIPMLTFHLSSPSAIHYNFNQLQKHPRSYNYWSSQSVLLGKNWEWPLEQVLSCHIIPPRFFPAQHFSVSARSSDWILLREINRPVRPSLCIRWRSRPACRIFCYAHGLRILRFFVHRCVRPSTSQVGGAHCLNLDCPWSLQLKPTRH